MKGDFTRNTFDPKKHHRDVLLQQGRVLVDADWNEQAELTARRDETTTADIIGDCGGPADNAAFAVFTDPSKLSAAETQHLQDLNITTPLAGGDFFLSAGRYYVDGIQCENEWPIPFSAQPDRRGGGPLDPGAYLLYLDVWKRHLTGLEDSSIRETALGGPDHGTRVKTIWQVRTLNLGPAGASADTDNPCGLGADLFDNLADPGTAKLTAGTAAQQAPKDPCLIPASAGYTGLENQLYRVEIHGRGTVFRPGNVADDTEVTLLGGSNALRPRPLPTTIWKWSRENGSVVTRIEKIDDNKITVSSLGPDKNLGFAKGAWVEILDDALELESKSGQLAQINDVDEATRIITLDATASSLAPSDPNYPNGIIPELHPKLRRWEGVASVQPGSWLPLESGVQVNFAPNGDYRTGHFWQIPARTATAQAPAGDIEWPVDNAGNRAALPAFGIKHHFCRLGIVTVNNGSIAAIDCRCLWPALTAVPRLFYVSGDGQEVMPAPPTASNLYKLPHPLIVGVANAHCLKQPLLVHFHVSAGGGLVALPEGVPAFSAKIPTDAAGLASCDFHLNGAAGHSQQVTAMLLDADGKPVGLPLIFNANLSIARQVAYDPGEDCAALQDQRTVQDAIARLASLARLEAVGGDGQDAEPGTELAKPIEVLVTSSCGPVAGATVNFDTGGTQAIATPPSVVTGADGVATCQWKPDPDPNLATQELTATLVLLPNNIPLSQPAQLRFTANLRLGHGGCCVTVGKGGEFQDLALALETLIGQGAAEICICLLPGDHEVNQLFINVPGINHAPNLRHVHIHGCGRASRILLKRRFLAILSSLTLEDLCIYADEMSPDGHGIDIMAIDVTIARCHLRQSGAGGDWVCIAPTSQAQEPGNQVGQILIVDNLIQSSQVPLKLSNLAPIEFDAQSDAVSTVDPQLIADAAAQSLASQSKSARTKFIKEFRKIARETPKSDPQKKVLEAALKRLTTTRSAAKGAAPAPAETLVESSRVTPARLAENLATATSSAALLIDGPALVIANANAETAIVNNIISSDVRFYGTYRGAFTAAQFNSKVADVFRKGPTKFIVENPAHTLRVEGNSLTKLVVDAEMEDRVKLPPPNQSGSATGLFARMSILDNTFSSAGQQWLAAHVISNGNHFIQPQAAPQSPTPNGAPLLSLGIAVGASFICVGTSCNFPAQLGYSLASGGGFAFNESANLITLWAH